MSTLPKSERLCGKTSVTALMSKGRWGSSAGLKYCFLEGEASGEDPVPNRMMVSVPKRFFKRAVKRNLLKRRIRESYRNLKEILPQKGSSIMFLYNTKEVLDSESIRSSIKEILGSLS